MLTASICEINMLWRNSLITTSLLDALHHLDLRTTHRRIYSCAAEAESFTTLRAGLADIAKPADRRKPRLAPLELVARRSRSRAGRERARVAGIHLPIAAFTQCFHSSLFASNSRENLDKLSGLNIDEDFKNFWNHCDMSFSPIVKSSEDNDGRQSRVWSRGILTQR